MFDFSLISLKLYNKTVKTSLEDVWKTHLISNNRFQMIKFKLVILNYDVYTHTWMPWISNEIQIQIPRKLI